MEMNGEVLHLRRCRRKVFPGIRSYRDAEWDIQVLAGDGREMEEGRSGGQRGDRRGRVIFRKRNVIRYD